MNNAQGAVALYCPVWWPEDTRLLIRRSAWTRPRSPPTPDPGAKDRTNHTATAFVVGVRIALPHLDRQTYIVSAVLQVEAVVRVGRVDPQQRHPPGGRGGGCQPTRVTFQNEVNRLSPQFTRTTGVPLLRLEMFMHRPVSRFSIWSGPQAEPITVQPGEATASSRPAAAAIRWVYRRSPELLAVPWQTQPQAAATYRRCL